MNKAYYTFLIAVFFHLGSKAQNMELPYYEIPEAPAEFTANGVAARMIDGLGFRFYWATEGLEPEDLSFRPNEDARSSEETIQHIMSLSRVIYRTVSGTAWAGSGDESFEVVRAETLKMLKEASDLLRKDENTLDELKVMFTNSEERTDIPFWNMINGPIADALWHTGQVVSFRRSSGNPLPSGVNVFSGKKRD